MSKLTTSICGIFFSVALNAQTVDIGLFPSQLNDTTLEVYVRPTMDYGDVVSWFTFTIQWPEASNDLLGTRVNACPEALSLNPTAMITSGGFHSRTYSQFGTSLLDDAGCPWTANQEHLIVSIPVYPHVDPLEQFCISDFDMGIYTGIIYSGACLTTGQAGAPSVAVGGIRVSPVPVVDDLVISMNDRHSVPTQLAILGMDGSKHTLRSTGSGRWDASVLAPGVYILQTEGGTARFVKL